MKILGNRVYLDLPEIPEHKVSISPELKKQLQEEKMKEFDRLKVYAVSEGIDNIKPGNEVFVDPNGLKRGVLLRIGEKEKISVSSYDIMHIW